MAIIATESDIQSLTQDLRRLVAGEVRFDRMTRTLYSTDASIYQIEPLGVVIPKTYEDVIAVVETANRYSIPVLPRGGGTSLAGQTVGKAIILDFSKYMRNVNSINLEEGWVRTQPGIILDELNQQLKPYNMMFAPDPSTSDRANVGGALGNNSCGAHSIMWGKTIDNLNELEVVLSNGDTAHYGSLNRDQIKKKMSYQNFDAEIYQKLFEIGRINRDEILSRYPKILRRVGGYNLDEVVQEGDFNMARFVVGSEGTLVTITEAKLRIVPSPKLKALAVIHFNDLISAMEATVVTLDLEPSAVELIDSTIIRQAQLSVQYSRMMDFMEGSPEALLLVELVDDSEVSLISRIDSLTQRMRQSNLGYSVRHFMNQEDQARIWAIRKAGLGLMMSMPGDIKPLPFVEDTAVSPEHLPKFIKRFDEIIKYHGSTAGFYGHASVGCLHIRPFLNLKLKDDVDRMVSISNQISDLVLEFGGAMSGEHGDGLVRSGWNEKMFGSAIYSAFREIKNAFDPRGIMNPGKIVDSPPMTQNLRISPAYSTRNVPTKFSFSKEGGFASAVEMCNGQGACRKVLNGTMCPSYMVTRDEEHSTRGRANALRAAISGDSSSGTFASERLYDVLDLCLECKACKVECPSNVDMAKFKYEFLNEYHKTHGFSLRNQIFGHISRFSRWGSFFAPISNWILRSGFNRKFIEKYVGIDSRRELPKFASQTFTQWFETKKSFPDTTSYRGEVLLLPDTFTNYNHPELGKAAVKVLEYLGYKVVISSIKCCGRPMMSNGMLDEARANAQFNVEEIYPYIEKGVKLVGLEPSCILNYKDDYTDLLQGDAGEKAKAVSNNTMLIEEFVMYAQREHGAKIVFKNSPGKLLFHAHCHQKALLGSQGAMDILRSIPGAEVHEVKSGCCGMAGSFGFEKEHYDISMKIGEQFLFPSIRSQEGEFTVVSEGISCRQQIKQGTGRKAKHLVEILADSI